MGDSRNKFVQAREELCTAKAEAKTGQQSLPNRNSLEKLVNVGWESSDGGAGGESSASGGSNDVSEMGEIVCGPTFLN